MGLQAKLATALICAKVLLQRPWFGRAWVIQEAALATRLQVQCGEKIVNWESLYSNLRLLSCMVDASSVGRMADKGFYQRLEFLESTRRSIQDVKPGPIEARETRSDDGRQSRRDIWKRLHKAVVNGRSYGASNERDHIYALLGLISKADDTLSVDYSLPNTAVFCHFVKRTMQQIGSLSVLGQVNSWASTTDASWVPDYSRPCMVEALSSDETPWYTSSGQSEIDQLAPNLIRGLSFPGFSLTLSMKWQRVRVP